MSTSLAYFHAKRVWKTVVENSVENVEKLEFSTAKPGFSQEEGWKVLYNFLHNSTDGNKDHGVTSPVVNGNKRQKTVKKVLKM